MEEIYDYAIDTTKLNNLISAIKTERDNMDNAVKNIYKTIDEIGSYWEGDAYNSARDSINMYHRPLDISIEMIDELLKLLNNNYEKSTGVINKITGMVSKE
jgi:uncharacterized protein YukE